MRTWVVPLLWLRSNNGSVQAVPETTGHPSTRPSNWRIKEPLIDSGASRLASEMCRFKAQIAGNICSIAKICNDEAGHFMPKMQVHE